MFDRDVEASTVNFDIVDEDDVDLMEPDAERETVPHVPPNPFESMKPLGIGRIKTSLSDVMNCFSKLSTDAQYEVSKSVIEIEEIMKRYRASRSKKHSIGTDLTAPAATRDTLQRASKRRLRTGREIARERQVAAGKRVSYQVEIGDSLTAVVPVRTRPTTCSFCGGGHKHTTCPKKRTLLAGSRLYEVSRDNPHVAAELKTRLRVYAPVTCLPDGAAAFTNLSDDLLRSNFLVNAAVSGDDTGCSLERMTFQVTFLNQAGDEHLDRSRMWITGDAMSSLVSFSRKKTKFVFDETIVMKDGWRERNILSQDPLRPS